ncbi:MAG: heavy metal-responsive transcriptional regulator [Acidobacteria bacterium]|nr:heavy metal-responsive transcriptional regulator [Acidobacteriota bacterium]
MQPGTLRIGEVARRAGVNIQTLRYYERIGLVKPDGRRDSGYRLYRDEVVRRIRFIKHAQQLGFTLVEIAELLRLRVDKTVRCDEVRRRAEARLRIVKEKVDSLRKMAKILEGLIHSCASRVLTDPCPILKSLEADVNTGSGKGVQA